MTDTYGLDTTYHDGSRPLPAAPTARPNAEGDTEGAVIARVSALADEWSGMTWGPFRNPGILLRAALTPTPRDGEA